MKKTALSLGLAMALIGPASTSQAATELNFATWMPPGHPINATILPQWAKQIEAGTEGRVSVKFEYNLGEPGSMFSIAEDGVADGAWGFHGYVPGRFPLTEAVEMPMLGANAEAASVSFWNVYNEYFAKAGEFDGLELMALCTHGQGQLHTKFPINALSDLKGKKIRVGGGVQSEIAKRMQVTPVAAPGPKIYELLQQGVIDGITMPQSEQRGLRLNEVTSHLTVYPSGLYLGSLSIFLNPDFMANLSDEDRAAIRRVSGESLSRTCGQAFDAADEDGIKAARENAVIVNELHPGDALTQELTNVLEGIDQVWLEKTSASGVDNKAALQALRQRARDYQPES
ncbi:TRAP transporter substrate-binding protein [Marinobacterium sp. BA1]|uniref:TRAP transporter substrate-binding protein n=1 Tax=Marinobacterium sp. BA1 TaxID=3138931 RepID=UPI0032E70E47